MLRDGDPVRSMLYTMQHRSLTDIHNPWADMRRVSGLHNDCLVSGPPAFFVRSLQTRNPAELGSAASSLLQQRPFLQILSDFGELESTKLKV